MKYCMVILVLLVVGCGGPNQEANKLFVEADQLIVLAESKANVSDDQEREAIKYYEKALSNVQRIIDDYPNSDLAVKLISGEALFTAGTVADVKQELALAKERVDKERREEQGTRK